LTGTPRGDRIARASALSTSMGRPQENASNRLIDYFGTPLIAVGREHFPE
jgi:hypothetical protein